MRDNRDGESGPTPMRSDRFFAVKNSWYFATREGASIGPFDDKNQASQGLSDFLDFIAIAEPQMLSSFYASLTSEAN